MAYLSFYLNLCPHSLSTSGHLQRLWSDLGGWKLLLWLVRTPGPNLGAGTSPGCAQYLTACLCSPWSFGHWPCCRSRASFLLPCSHPSRHCSFCGHGTWLTCSWPAQISSSAQSRTHWSFVLFAWNDLLCVTFSVLFSFFSLPVVLSQLTVFLTWPDLTSSNFGWFSLFLCNYFTYVRLDLTTSATMLCFGVCPSSIDWMATIYQTKYHAQQQHRFWLILIYSSRSV